MNDLGEEIRVFFYKTADALSVIFSLDERYTLVVASVGVFFVYIAFLVTRAFHKRKKGVDMSSQEDNPQKNQGHSDRLIFRNDNSKTPERVRTAPPSIDDIVQELPVQKNKPDILDGPDKANAAFDMSASCQISSGQALADPVGQEIRPEIAVKNDNNKTSINPVEPGITIEYKTRKSVSEPARKEVVEKMMKEQIDKFPLPFGTVGQQYESVLDFSDKAFVDVFGDIEILRFVVSKKLEKLGIACLRQEKKTSLRLSGIPTEEYEGPFCFFLINDDWKSTLPKKPEEKTPINSFFELPKECVHFKPFQINADPRNLWKNLPVEDYDGYENKNEDCGGVVKRCGFTDGQEVEIIAASQRGRSHAHAAKPRDDCYTINGQELPFAYFRNYAMMTL